MSEAVVKFLKRISWVLLISFIVRCAISWSEIKTGFSLYTIFGYAGEAIAFSSIFAALYEKIIWKYDPLLKWPVLYKEYKGTIKSNYDGTSRDISVRVKQSLFSVYVFLKTDESNSNAITADIVNRDGEYVLCYSYLNHPKAEVRERSEIHYGTSILRIEEKAKQLEGTYFTDRNTTGDIILHGIEMKKQKGQT